MIVDDRFIELGVFKDTLNKAQFEILNQEYPPVDGWRELVMGRELSTKETNLFLLLRGDLALKAQKQIIKNYQLLAEFHKEAKTEPKTNSKTPKVDSNSSTLTIYCDGACHKNPGKAGSGLAIYNGEDKPILLYGEYESNGTNNTAELNALYKAMLLAKEGTKATIYSDSMYSIDCITNWAYGWKKKGWKRKGGEIKNLEIIKKAHKLYETIKDSVVIKHVKGHSGVEGNELADRMAVWAIISKSKKYKAYKYQSIDKVLAMSEG